MHLILHLGPSKTGSSSIQVALRSNRQLLKRKGIHLSQTSGNKLCLRYRYRDKVPPNMEARLGNLGELISRAEDDWRNFEREVSESDCDTILVSSEDIPSAALRDEMMGRFKNIFNKITPILYFRDPVDLYISELNQRFRHGLRFRDAPSPSSYKYRHLEFADWAAANAEGSAIVTRNFDRSNLDGGDVVRDFFRILSDLCGAEIDFSPPNTPVNSSLTGAATAWMVSFNEILDRRIRNVNKRIISNRSEVVAKLRQSADVNSHQKLKLSDALLQSIIRQKADEDLKAINSRYLQGQVPLKTDDSPPVTLSDEAVRLRMQDWLIGYLSPDAARDIIRVMIS